MSTYAGLKYRQWSNNSIKEKWTIVKINEEATQLKNYGQIKKYIYTTKKVYSAVFVPALHVALIYPISNINILIQ